MREFTKEERAEIMRAYSERGVSSAKMIGILADLNMCTRTDIKQVLGLAVAPKESRAGGRGARWSDEQTDLLRALYARTHSVAELSRLLGEPAARVKNKIAKMKNEGLLPSEQRGEAG